MPTEKTRSPVSADRDFGRRAGARGNDAMDAAPLARHSTPTRLANPHAAT